MHFFYTSLCLWIALITPSFAAQFTIQDPCGGKPWLQTQSDQAIGSSVGALTVRSLQEAGLHFVGTEAGITSIEGVPAAEKALETVDAQTMRAYGWCYQIDGFEPGVMPDQYQLTKADVLVVWFLGYATYTQGQWVTMCAPTAKDKPVLFCQP